MCKFTWKRSCIIKKRNKTTLRNYLINCNTMLASESFSVFLFLESKRCTVTKIICGGDHSFLLYSNDQVCDLIKILVTFLPIS